MKNFSGSTLHNNSQTANHIRERNNRKYSLLSAVPLRFSLRGYGFCMATLFLFCFCSLFYQLNGGPPKILFDIRQYLGKSTTFFLPLLRSVAQNQSAPPGSELYLCVYLQPRCWKSGSSDRITPLSAVHTRTVEPCVNFPVIFKHN